MFGRLELATVAVEHEANAVGQGEVLRPCQPAFSSVKHDALVGPGPTDLAKSTRMSSNNSLQTALAMFHAVQPVAGSRKPIT
jgi:hypothetical protein